MFRHSIHNPANRQGQDEKFQSLDKDLGIRISRPCVRCVRFIPNWQLILNPILILPDAFSFNSISKMYELHIDAYLSDRYNHFSALFPDHIYIGVQNDNT